MPTPDDPRPETVHGLFDQIAFRSPAALAVKFGSACCTYEELAGRAAAVANVLPPLDAAQESAFLILVGRDPVAELAAILGVMSAGAVAVPIDVDQPAQRLKRIVVNCAPSAILVPSSTAEPADDVTGGVGVITIPDVAERRTRPIAPVTADDPAYVCYTSGSTGDPKGIVTTHRQLIARADSSSASLQCGPSDRHTLLHSVSAGAGCSTVWRTLLAGGALLPRYVRRDGVDGMLEWLNEERATVLACAGTLFRTLMASFGDSDRLQTVRLLRLGGERVTPGDLMLFKRHFLPGAVLLNAYSCTESSNVTLHALTHESSIDGEFVPVGRPPAGCTVTILGDNGRTLPDGETGEIAVEGPYLARGYWRDPSVASGHFELLDEASGRRRLRTGDVGYLTPDGVLVHLGRKDFRVKIRGFRVEIEGIESALQNAPGVHRAAVIVHEPANSPPYLIAYVTVSSDVTNSDAIRSFATAHLPVGSVPSRIVIIDRFPLTPSGKADRAALQSLADAPDPAAGETNAALTTSEEGVAAIWAELLGPQPFEAGSDFFGCGGDSLLAMRVLTRIKRQVGADVALSEFFESPTIAGLASRIDDWQRQQAKVDEVELARLLDEIDGKGSGSGR